MSKTSIEWCDHSINPFRARDKITQRVGHFCVKISPGCKNCFSSRLQSRFGTHEFVVANRSKVDLFLDESKLQEVLSRRVPTKYFWCDMTDMFLDDYPDKWIDQCFATMALTPQHTHLVLTKRPERMLACCKSFGTLSLAMKGINSTKAFYVLGENVWNFSNIWLGVSCEDQATADERIPLLLQTPAAVRFVSYEPALEPVDFASISQCMNDNEPTREQLDGPSGVHYVRHGVPGIDWLIVGGESGPGARPFEISWARKTIAQCKASGVAVFCKQLGAVPLIPEVIRQEGESGCSVIQRCSAIDREWPEGTHFGNRTGNPALNGRQALLHDKKGGDWNEWPQDLRVREFPT